MSVPTITTTVLACTRGDTASWDFTVLDQAGAAVNLTGSSTLFTVRDTYAVAQTTDADAVLHASTATEITYPTPASGIGRLVLSPTQTRALSPRSYPFDLQIKDGSGNTYTVARGVLLVQNEQTRTT